MSDSLTSLPATGLSRDERMSGLFASLVLQQTNMALMMLGKTPPPEGAEPFQDLDSARVFIDQLEMLQAKTRGNLSPDEEKLLKQNLTALRMAFVEAVDSAGGEKPAAKASVPAAGQEQSASKPEAPPTSSAGEEAGASGEGPHKKFSKKY